MMEDAFLKKGKRMSDDEIKAHLRKNSSPRKGSFELETEGLRKAIHDHVLEWFGKAIGRFLDSGPGQAFLEKHKDKSSEDVFEIFERDTNFRELLSREVKNKIDELRGKIV